MNLKNIILSLKSQDKKRVHMIPFIRISRSGITNLWGKKSEQQLPGGVTDGLGRVIMNIPKMMQMFYV